MSINFAPMLGIGLGFGAASMVSNWGGQVGGCCQRLLGQQQGGLVGSLMGGLVGTLAGGGNPLFGLLGAGIGGLVGSAFGGRNHCQQANYQNPCHGGAGSYPVPYGHQFGGAQMGGYGCSPNFGNQYGGGFDGGFGGQYGGGYGQQFGGQCSPWGGNFGQQYFGGGFGNGNGCFGPGQNFNFGQQCPQSCCYPGQPPQGQLSQEGGEGKPMQYKTSGGYTIKVDKHTITVTDPQGKNTVEHWGDPHENLNGKHIKDWETKQRSIILGDGTKITMTAQGPQGVTESMSIYDGRQNVQIDNNQNKITHKSMNPWDTMYRERSQHDGETAIFRTNNRTGAATYSNVYTQDENFGINRQYTQLGSTGGYKNPNQINDFYDDPRLGHT